MNKIIFFATLASSLIASPLSVFADNINGLYELRDLKHTGALTINGILTPICEPVVGQPIYAYADLDVKYRKTSVVVNGEEWLLLRDNGSVMIARQPTNDPSAQLELWLWRSGGTASANLMLKVSSPAGQLLCAVTRSFAGSYRR